MFAALEAQLVKVNTQLEELIKFSSLIIQPCFDKDDQKLVACKVKEVTELKTLLEETLKKRRLIYQTQVCVVEEHIGAREEVFQHSSELFDEFPDILEYFVKKQDNLKTNLDGIKTRLQAL